VVPQLQCYPAGVIWQPGTFPQQEISDILALEVGLSSWHDLVSGYTTVPGSLSIEDRGPYNTPGRFNGGLYAALDAGTADIVGSAEFLGAFRVSYLTAGGPFGDFALRFCVNLRDNSIDQPLWGFKDNSNNTIIRVYYSALDDRFLLEVLDATAETVVVVADQIGSPAVGTWYCLYCEGAGGFASIRGLTPDGLGVSYTEPIFTGLRVTYPYGHLTRDLPAADTKPLGGFHPANPGGLGTAYVCQNPNDLTELGKAYLSGIGLWQRPLNRVEIAEVLINDFGVVRIWPAGQEPSNDLSTALAPPTAFAFEASNSLSWENADAFHSIELYQDDGQGRGQNLYQIGRAHV